MIALAYILWGVLGGVAYCLLWYRLREWREKAGEIVSRLVLAAIAAALVSSMGYTQPTLLFAAGYMAPDIIEALVEKAKEGEGE